MRHLIIFSFLLLASCALQTQEPIPSPEATTESAQPPPNAYAPAWEFRGGMDCRPELTTDESGKIKPTGIWFCQLPQAELPDPPEESLNLVNPELIKVVPSSELK